MGIRKANDLNGASKSAQLKQEIICDGSEMPCAHSQHDKIKKLISDVTDRASHLCTPGHPDFMKGKNTRGPVLSGIYDIMLDNDVPFYGQNFETTVEGDEEYLKWLTDDPEAGGAEPLIKELEEEYFRAKIASAEERSKLPIYADYREAAHSELRALDKVLKERKKRGLPTDRSALKDMYLHNRILLKDSEAADGRKPPPKDRCVHCSYLTSGMIPVGHK